MIREAYVHILTNRYHTVLYTGVTYDIHRRMHEHSEKQAPSFSAWYNLTKLIYIERYFAIERCGEDSIRTEKQFKGYSPAKWHGLFFCNELITPPWNLYGTPVITH